MGIIFGCSSCAALQKLELCNTSYANPSCVTISCDVNPCNIFILLLRTAIPINSKQNLTLYTVVGTATEHLLRW